MALDRHGIPVPAAGEELGPAIVLLPLVAFDPQGFRLGYGGGYFDRTLATMVPRPLAVGVGFELGRVAAIRPLARTTFRSMRRSPRPAIVHHVR
jgi:5-formyltetrahydrofolate cyclo-ligase